MTLEGTIRDGMVVLDRAEGIRDGMRVQVVIPDADVEEPTYASLLELAGTVDGLPPDMARNHNHYLHGHPKQ